MVQSTRYRGNYEWRDMSEFAVHFTKPASATSAYDVMLKILWEGHVVATNRFGAARNFQGLGESQKCACFSEIPLDLLGRLIARRSLYGIGFRQDFLVQQGGARVWYLEREGRVAGSFQNAMHAASASGLNPSDDIWKLTPFVDFPGAYGTAQYRFEWEREWRVPFGLTFRPEDVAFLFIPDSQHDTARSFFDEHQHNGTGPAYLCPYIDPRWDLTRIEAALSSTKAQSIPAGINPIGMCPYCGSFTMGGICIDCGNTYF